LLGSKEKIHETILREGMEIVEKHGSDRRTQIVDNGKFMLRSFSAKVYWIMHFGFKVFFGGMQSRLN